MFVYNIKCSQEKINLDIIIDSKLFQIKHDDVHFETILKLIQNERDTIKLKSEVSKILNIKLRKCVWSDNLFVTEDSVIYKDTEFLSKKFRNKVINLVNNKVPLDNISLFCEKLIKNPDIKSVYMLFDFLEYCDIPITDTGNFLAYKSVRHDYYDQHSGTIHYGIGETITMDRALVAQDADTPCSTGLHVGSLNYATSFAPRLLLVEVNPTDVVSVPKDHSFQKLRCCKLKVISEFNGFGSLKETSYNIDGTTVTVANAVESAKLLDVETALEGFVIEQQVKPSLKRDPVTGRFVKS
jgi:hypothetical protein